MITTLNLSAPSRNDSPREPQWEETRSVFPIYLALAKQLAIDIPIPQAKRNLPEKAEMELFSQVQTWLDSMDRRVLVHELRHLLQMTTLNASESGLRALIQRHLRKPTKSNTDRDKIDFLLVQYFALCAPAKIYHKQIERADVALVMQPIFGKAPATPLAWCEPLENMIVQLRDLRTLKAVTKTDFIAQGRKIKESAGTSFYETSALLSFVRFNFLLRRTLIELMHADLIAIRAVLTQLEAAGIALIDCTHAGLGAAEALPKIRQLADEWKQPFQQEYTERSVTQAFEKLLGLRSDADQALAKMAGTTGGALTEEKTAPTAQASIRSPHNSERSTEPEAVKSAGAPALDFESCLEQIWEQLIATPPLRGRSMTTVRVEGARVLMSSWEVAAFVSEDGPAAEDLRRAVVARALVTAALEFAKSTGNATALERALPIARVEVTRLQERVDIAKQAKNTEAAVNLGISTKRLLSALDEAETL